MRLSSTPNAQPKPTIIATTIALVLALHGGVAIGLMMMPTLTIQSPKATPPLEISFIAPPKPAEPEAIASIQAEPITEPTTQPAPSVEPKNTPSPKQPTAVAPEQPAVKAKVEPKIESKPTVEKKTEPVAKPQQTPEQPKPTNTVKNPTPEPFSHLEQPLDPQAILAQQAKDAQNIAQQKALQQALDAQRQQQRQADIARQQAKDAQAQQQADNAKRQQAEQERLAKEKLAREQAEQAQAEKARADREKIEREKANQEKADREKAAREKADSEKAEKLAQAKKTAENTQPVSFGNGDADWRSKPNLNFTGYLARIIQKENLSSIGVKLNVSASGSVTSVTITRSSGNSQVDNAVRQRLLSAKLKPFIRNGVAVAGVGNLTINLH